MAPLPARFALFHRELVRLDQAVGGPAFFQTQAAAPMFMPTGMADAWIAFGAFPAAERKGTGAP